MPLLKLRIDVSGTIGDEAWQSLRHFDEAEAGGFGPRYGSSGECAHPPGEPHSAGEWVGARVKIADPLLAQYAVSHYLEQERVLDVDVQ
jgi:hypothetical protein